MADTATAEPDLSALTNSPPLKRKRGGPDSSPDSRRNKRGIPPATMAADALSAAFMESADTAQAAHAAAAAAGVNVSDFSALQQAAAEHSEASDPANASSTAAAALGSMYPTLHIPQSTEETFAAQAGVDTDHHDTSYADVGHDGLPMDTSGVSTGGIHPANGVRQDQRYGSTPNPKPAVGSEEWHKMRKDNHKEVERRRRETINEGINELAKIVPGCEKNKGSILQRAVAFITQLKENESQNIEKWTLEKLLTEQAIAELSSSNDKLKLECERLYRELETWKRAAQSAGLELPSAEKTEPGTS
ncbi:putative helix-loop-helix dna binding protein [Phaeoacremonium minimum UCRPA7]|uniref:Putative helix-loop-helix dna binding protein n=1 Tax=Phaeoacremonium minimum (strain UCR-PA7) TaxID=1286976 RepID=R8BFU0_PHAM7|nr:putative helix-loop-helix dna binding protein [Phaeoacremonium minimum UCRPA7]EON98154.1 putative helix-loop-helix dna binding protein [Phaeoacremonium minimum UCRPA7]